MGLIPDVAEVAQWSGWGIDLVDLDNDGLLDAAVAGGAPLGGAPENAVHSDHLFEGVSADPMRFEPRRGTDFDSEDNHYGLVAADLDGDGYLEVLVLGAPGPVKYWQNTCGVGRWLEVDLQGPTPNVKGIGARITVQSSNGREVREVQTVRAMMQSPARQHFGLGDTEQATVTVIWPDGAVSEGTVGTNRLITVVHPG